MREEILNLTKKLIQIPSESNNFEELRKILNLIREYFSLTSYKIIELENNNWKSMLISKVDNPKILMCGHVDVVPAGDWKEAFNPKVNGEYLVGRGSMDMKSQVAMLMKLFKDLDTIEHSTGLLIVTDEEIGGFNGGKLWAEKLSPEIFIAAEPTFLGIGNSAKGILRLEVEFIGKRCHASRPWEGENAALKLSKFLEFVKEKESNKEQWRTTYNIGKIQGGDAVNVVMDKLVITLDVRFVPEDNPQGIAKNVSEIDGVNSVKIVMNESAVKPINSKHIDKLEESLKKRNVKELYVKKHGGSDARFFARKNIPAITLGPTGYNGHGLDEKVLIEDLVTCYEIFRELIVGSL